MDILIYGGGAVGLGIGSCLIRSGAGVTILCRSDTKTLLDRRGLDRSGIFGEFHAMPASFRTVIETDECRDKTFDYILVCTKSFDTEKAALDIASHMELLGKNGRIVLFQNGWGNAEIMAAHVPPLLVYSGRVITGFIRPEKNTVRVTVHADAIHLGSLFLESSCEELVPLCNAISDGGIACINVPDVGRDLWAKMLYNCALNPLGAIFSVPYGTLADREESRAIMNSIIDEIYVVMQKCGFETHWKTPKEYSTVFYRDLVRLTAGHESSMLQDIRSGRKTEINALNGEIVRLSSDPATEAPVNLAMRRMIGFIESRNRTRD